MTLTGKTQILAVIGDPISHSASPVMQNQALQSLGLDFVYIPIHIQTSEALGDFFSFVRTSNFAGLNVTVPYKDQVLPYLDELRGEALAAQAVNTIVKEENKLIGYNTDGAGFLLSVKETLSTRFHQKRVALIGAGGAAKGILAALAKESVAEIGILNRTESKAHTLVAQFARQFPQISVIQSDQLGAFDMVINTTSVGMHPNEQLSPLHSYDWVTPNHLCCDIIYEPRVTRFLSSCQEKSAKICGGEGMLAGQGALAFELFTGQKIAYHFMKEALKC